MAARPTRKRSTRAIPAAPIARAFDLASSPALEETVTLHCIDGPTGEPLGLRLDVAASYSKTARIAEHKGLAMLRAARPDLKDADVETLREEATRYILAHCVIGWDLLEAGAPLGCTPDNVLRLFAHRGDVYAQVKVAHEDRKVFHVPAPTS